MRRAAPALLVLAAVACQENVLAPGVCPEFCPPGTLDVRDTILTNVIFADSFFVGYRLAHEATQLQIAGPGGDVESRGLIVFRGFTETYSGADTTVSRTIQQTDSFRVTFTVLRRNAGVSGVALALYRIPLTVDSTATFASMEPYFDDSMLVGTASIPDSFTIGSFDVTVPAAAFPNYGGDTLQVAVGVRIQAPEPVFISVPSQDSLGAAIVARFVQVDSGTVRVTRSDARLTLFDTFVLNETGGTGAGILRIGGVPAARALLRADTSRSGPLAAIIDSTQIVRATLLLVPARPAIGAAGDTFRLRVHAIGADLGPKSPIIQESDTLSAGSTRIPVGASDTLLVDVTHVFQAWRADPDIPRAFMLRVVPEAASLGALEVGSTASGAARPALHLTYLLPFRIKQ